MRNAHNNCKRELLARAIATCACTLESCSVLDVACGRGGDLNKLKGCLSYTGVDSSSGALHELQRRANEICMPVTVHCMDATLLPAVACNLVGCNFALHYFCDTQAHLEALLDMVSASLVCGGVFCGTYERTQGTVSWGVPFHAVIGDCVNALEWRLSLIHI